jgi:hypothetical protein
MNPYLGTGIEIDRLYLKLDYWLWDCGQNFYKKDIYRKNLRFKYNLISRSRISVNDPSISNKEQTLKA